LHGLLHGLISRAHCDGLGQIITQQVVGVFGICTLMHAVQPDAQGYGVPAALMTPIGMNPTGQVAGVELIAPTDWQYVLARAL
jgi:hypothetical protein